MSAEHDVRERAFAHQDRTRRVVFEKTTARKIQRFYPRPYERNVRAVIVRANRCDRSLVTGQSQIDDNTREYLNSKGVCVIAPLPGEGIKLYGDRVPSSDKRIPTIGASRLMKLLKYSGKIGYSWAVFYTVDGQGRLFRDLKSTGEAFLRPFFEAGALYGKDPRGKDAFMVFVDENDTVALSQGKVPVHWGVRLSRSAEQILLFIDNVPLTQDLSVLQS
jgi:hypothetical protein